MQKRGRLLEVETTQGKKGRRAKYGIVTRTGLKDVDIDGRSGRGGPKHRHFQALVRQMAEAHGYIADDGKY